MGQIRLPGCLLGQDHRHAVLHKLSTKRDLKCWVCDAAKIMFGPNFIVFPAETFTVLLLLGMSEACAPRANFSI